MSDLVRKHCTPKEMEIVEKHFNLAADHYKKGNHSQCIEEAQKALAIKPDAAECVSLIAGCMLDLGKTELSLQLHIKAFQLNPVNQMVVNNIGKYWEVTGDWENAIQFYMAALRQNPGSFVMKNNCGLALLSCGQLAEGWDYWEARHELARRYGVRMTRMMARHFPQPTWNKEPLIGKRLIVSAEQGVGDHFLFATMLPELKKFGGEVWVEVDRRLVDVMQNSLPEFNFVPIPYKKAETGEDHFHYHIPMGCLGRLFRREFKQFPTKQDYLKPDPILVEKWKERFAPFDGKIKIGLSWRSMNRDFDRQRFYADIPDLAPLMNIPNAVFINMQYAYEQDELDEFEKLYGQPLHNWDDINLKDDLGEVAAYAANLDMNISPQSTPATITGAQSIPTAIFTNNDKRNINTLGQNRHMWFPSAKLFFKSDFVSKDSNWENCFDQIAKDITTYFEDPSQAWPLSS